MATNLSNVTFSNVYKDDFADSDNFHRILFNSGKALQARELTQMQTIIQKEIERFGSNIFRDGGADFCGQITCIGSSNTVAYNTSSDARLKNVLGKADGLKIINQLNPVHFEWKKSGFKQDGLIAQEVESIVPNAVTHSKDSDVYSIDYSKLVTPLIKAIQEQQEQIDALQSEINNLKGE